MTILVFIGSLLLAMLIGIPISFALLASGVALMWQLDMFDAQILVQNLVGGQTASLFWLFHFSCLPGR